MVLMGVIAPQATVRAEGGREGGMGGLNSSSHRAGSNHEPVHMARGAAARPSSRASPQPSWGAAPASPAACPSQGGAGRLSDQRHLLDAGVNLPRPRPASDRLLLQVLPGPPHKPTLCEGLSHRLPHPDLCSLLPEFHPVSWPHLPSQHVLHLRAFVHVPRPQDPLPASPLVTLYLPLSTHRCRFPWDALPSPHATPAA